MFLEIIDEKEKHFVSKCSSVVLVYALCSLSDIVVMNETF